MKRGRTPALVFCFDREVCWDTAEVLKGKDLFAEGQRKALLDRLEAFDFSVGSGNRLRTFLRAASAFITRACCRAIGGWWRRFSRRSCCRFACARRRWRRGSICRRGRWC